jgi:hypothetical protein
MGLIRSINPNSTENKNYERVQSFCQKRTKTHNEKFKSVSNGKAAWLFGQIKDLSTNQRLEYKSKLLKRVEMSQKAITTGNELKSIDFQFRMKS